VRYLNTKKTHFLRYQSNSDRSPLIRLYILPCLIFNAAEREIALSSPAKNRFAAPLTVSTPVFVFCCMRRGLIIGNLSFCYPLCYCFVSVWEPIRTFRRTTPSASLPTTPTASPQLFTTLATGMLNRHGRLLNIIEILSILKNEHIPQHQAFNLSMVA